MAEGNGIDLGSIYGLLLDVAKTVSRHDAMLLTLQNEMRQMRAEMGQTRAEMATKGELAELRQDFVSFRRDITGDIASLRQTFVEYHSTVLGHGILIPELDDRVRRIERHLDLPQFTPR